MDGSSLTAHQVLESNDHILSATLYSHVGDAYVGLAGLDNPSTPQGSRMRAANMSRAEVYSDRARECKYAYIHHVVYVIRRPAQSPSH